MTVAEMLRPFQAATMTKTTPAAAAVVLAERSRGILPPGKSNPEDFSRSGDSILSRRPRWGKVMDCIS